MSYRDELGAAQSRIDALERELKTAKDELESVALVPRSSTAIANTPGQKAARRWLGAPTRVRGERVVDGEIDDTAYAEMLDCLAESFDAAGRSSVVPGRLDWVSITGNDANAISVVSFSVTSGKGKTVIRGEVRMRNLAGAIFGGVGGGVGIGVAFAPGLLFMVSPLIGALALTAWFGGVYAGCRKLFSSSSNKKATQVERALDQLEAVAKSAPKKAPKKGAE